jgi:hypothetical protein
MGGDDGGDDGGGSSPRRQERAGDHAQDLAGSDHDSGAVTDPVGSLPQVPAEFPTVRETDGIATGEYRIYQRLRVNVEVVVPSGWHVYGLPIPDG